VQERASERQRVPELPARQPPVQQRQEPRRPVWPVLMGALRQALPPVEAPVSLPEQRPLPA